MSKSRIKTAVPVIRSREEMEMLVGTIASLKAEEQRLTADLNARVTVVRKSYESQLAEIAESLEEMMEQAGQWAASNPTSFGQAKSISMTHGDVGYRIGNPTLKTLSGWTWDRVLEKLREGGIWMKYLRVKTEVNKEGLLADRADLGDALKSIGVRVVQQETFYIEPRLVAAETRLQEVA